MTEHLDVGSAPTTALPRPGRRWTPLAIGVLASTSLLVAPLGASRDVGTVTASPIEAEVVVAPLSSGEALRVHVPGAEGGKTVIGQLTVARATEPGYVTAYGCDNGLPLDAAGRVDRSDLNYDGRVSPNWSNRLIVEADDDGDVCFYTLRALEMIVDVNAVSFDTGITSFPNRRTDTRLVGGPLEAGGTLRINVPEAAGSKTVIGQLTSARATDPGFVTAYGCDNGLPRDAAGDVARSDLNYDGRVTPQRSNRLIVEADADGDICFFTLRSAHLVIDVNGVSDAGITSFDNRRTDTRYGTEPGSRDVPLDENGIPVWPPYDPLPAIAGVSALTGLPAPVAVTERPIIAVKVDNYRLARPHLGLDQADAVMEVNIEGVSRFIALFHSSVPPSIGPVRSARTTDLDLLAAMNRPVFAYSGANPGVTSWIEAAAGSGLLVDRNAQHNGCYSREPDRVGPHNLVLDPTCVLAAPGTAGPARPLWTVDAAWTIPASIASAPDTTFEVPMDGVRVEWTWDPSSRTYLRSQDGAPHVTDDDTRIAASTVVELTSVHVPSPVDARSPHVITLGSGNARVHRDGIAVLAMWSRDRPYDPFTFRDATTGVPIPLDTGVTFLEFVRDR